MTTRTGDSFDDTANLVHGDAGGASNSPHQEKPYRMAFVHRPRPWLHGITGPDQGSNTSIFRPPGLAVFALFVGAAGKYLDLLLSSVDLTAAPTVERQLLGNGLNIAITQECHAQP